MEELDHPSIENYRVVTETKSELVKETGGYMDLTLPKNGPIQQPDNLDNWITRGTRHGSRNFAKVRDQVYFFSEEITHGEFVSLEVEEENLKPGYDGTYITGVIIVRKKSEQPTERQVVIHTAATKNTINDLRERFGSNFKIVETLNTVVMYQS